MKTITIRNVPEELQRLLKERAEKAGLSLSEYLLGELTKMEDRPSHQDLMERLRKRTPVKLGVAAADLIREEREERDRHWDELWSSSTPRR